MGSVTEPPSYEIPKFCKAGVMTQEGKDFKVEVQMVPVPEPGMQSLKVHERPKR